MFLRRTKTAIALALGIALLSTGCSSGLVKSLANLNELRQHITAKYHDEVNVNLQNSRFLSIVFINSPLNKQSHTSRVERAQNVATFTALNYNDIKSVENIWISFIQAETHFIVFHYTDGIDSFGFDKNGGPLNDGFNAEKDDPRTPIVRFSATRNETDVSITRLQLEGDMNHGIALVPSFTVPGNRDKNGKVAAPTTVTFDFASYAGKKVFYGNSPLIIEADDHAIYTGEARLMVPDVAGPNANSLPQFLRTAMSFEQFFAIANAQKVLIKLGPKEFQLGPDDVDALHKMAGHVELRPPIGK